MYRIIDVRSNGKTNRLMLLAKENNALFICNNPRAMEAKAHNYGIVGINFIDYASALNNMKNFESQLVVIDEIEQFVQYTLSNVGCLIGYTLSNED